MQIGLKWKNMTGAPAINIYPSADGDGSSSYLTADAAAQDQITGVFNDAVRDKNNKQTIDANGTFIFKPDYWNNLSDDNPKKCLLFEGASEGKGELTIVFLDKDGNELAEVGSVWLDLKDIKKMYQRASATPDPLTPLDYTMSIAAHSMGNVVVGSALKSGLTVDEYILMEAAIPSGCYNDSVNNYSRFLNAEATNPTPDTESELGYRLLIQPFLGNVGKIISFFNIDDYALATGTTAFLGWPFETNWEKNQVDFKPNRLTSQNSTYGDYLFSANQPTGSQVSIGWNQDITGTYLSSRTVIDIHESMAFVARPRSKAGGTETHNASVFGSAVNLQALSGF